MDLILILGKNLLNSLFYQLHFQLLAVLCAFLSQDLMEEQS